MSEVVLTEDVYIKITFKYTSYLFPYDDGIAIMSLFKNAIEFEEAYNKPIKLTHLIEGPEIHIIRADTIKEKMMTDLLENKK